jgi:hypothetical protein
MVPLCVLCGSVVNVINFMLFLRIEWLALLFYTKLLLHFLKTPLSKGYSKRRG